MIQKITEGFVVQEFDPKTGKFIDQHFITGDKAHWEDNSEQPGKNIDPPTDEYLPFDMVQPKDMEDVNEPLETKKAFIILDDQDYHDDSCACELCSSPVKMRGACICEVEHPEVVIERMCGATEDFVMSVARSRATELGYEVVEELEEKGDFGDGFKDDD